MGLHLTRPYTKTGCYLRATACRSHVDHQAHAERVGAHAERIAPHGLVEGHDHHAAGGEFFKVAGQLGLVIAAERDDEVGARAVFHARGRTGSDEAHAVGVTSMRCITRLSSEGSCDMSNSLKALMVNSLPKMEREEGHGPAGAALEAMYGLSFVFIFPLVKC